MARIPDQVSVLLSELTENLSSILGRNLVGIYLYGSLTQRAFNRKRSDVDCLVVTKRDLSESQFKKIGEWFDQATKSNMWVSRLQIQFLIKDKILTMNARACLYQFGKFTHGGSDGNPIIWKNVLQSGVTLFGAPPESFVPAITSEILNEALRRELEYLREEITKKPESDWRNVSSYRAYAVLTVCRILYSARKGTVVSKPRAAHWALKRLPKEWHPIITQALEINEATDGAEPHAVSLGLIRRFIDFARMALNRSHQP
jgi:Domain of unknown function (DUF4111)